MSEFTIATWICVAILAGVTLGAGLRSVLPAEHMNDHSRQIVNVAIGLIATLSALVLGLLVASSKATFEAHNDEIKQNATRVILLDRTLREYGPEADDIRALLLELTQRRIDHTWNPASTRQQTLAEDASSSELIRARLWRLSPNTDVHRWLLARALTLTAEIEQGRWLVVEGEQSSIPRPFLAVLASWLVAIFTALGLLAPRNGTVYAVLFICALAVSMAILMILEMDQPFEGIVQVSKEPLVSAIDEMKR